MNRILITLLLAIACAQPALAMEPEKDHNTKIEEAREIHDQQPLEQNAPMTPIAPTAQPEEAVVAEQVPPHNDNAKQTKLIMQLIDATIKGDATSITRLIAAKANVNSQLNNFTALDHAVSDNQEQICKILISNGAKINAQDMDGNTALMSAVRQGYESLTRLLIEHNANLEILNKQGFTPLMLAGMYGHENICKILLMHRIDIIDTQNATGETAFKFAAYKGHEQICKLYLACGANINIQDKLGRTALFIAALSDNEKACKLLVTHGANIETGNVEGKTPLMIAAHYGRKSACKAIITHATFNPFRTEAQIHESQERIHTARLALIRARPNLPRDVRDLIFLAEPELGLDFCCVATNIHRNKHHRVPFMPLQVVGRLIEKGMLNPTETIKVIQAHNYKCLRQLMLNALPSAQKDVMKELLNPDNLDKNFGDEIKQNIERRLPTPTNK